VAAPKRIVQVRADGKKILCIREGSKKEVSLGTADSVAKAAEMEQLLSMGIKRRGIKEAVEELRRKRRELRSKRRPDV